MLHFFFLNIVKLFLCLLPYRNDHWGWNCATKSFFPWRWNEFWRSRLPVATAGWWWCMWTKQHLTSDCFLSKERSLPLLSWRRSVILTGSKWSLWKVLVIYWEIRYCRLIFAGVTVVIVVVAVFVIHQHLLPLLLLFLLLLLHKVTLYGVQNVKIQPLTSFSLPPSVMSVLATNSRFFFFFFFFLE